MRARLFRARLYSVLQKTIKRQSTARHRLPAYLRSSQLARLSHRQYSSHQQATAAAIQRQRAEEGRGVTRRGMFSGPRPSPAAAPAPSSRQRPGVRRGGRAAEQDGGAQMTDILQAAGRFVSIMGRYCNEVGQRCGAILHPRQPRRRLQAPAAEWFAIPKAGTWAPPPTTLPLTPMFRFRVPIPNPKPDFEQVPSYTQVRRKVAGRGGGFENGKQKTVYSKGKVQKIKNRRAQSAI